jgi:uncharacterized membrane protein YhaH (DUF805 family)
MEMMLLQQLLIVIYFGFSILLAISKESVPERGEKTLGSRSLLCSLCYILLLTTIAHRRLHQMGYMHFAFICAAGNDVQFTWL